VSGFAAGYGRPEPSRVEAMLDRINHRGPDARATLQLGRTVLAQNYLQADGLSPDGPVVIPAAGPGGLRICFDGQIGNLPQLASRHGLNPGPLAAERLILELYRQAGPDMLAQLKDSIFALAISDGEDFFAARDLLGIKTLFYAWEGQTLYLSSELKSLVGLAGEIREFPAGHYLDRRGRLVRFAELPQQPPPAPAGDIETMAARVRSLVERSFSQRVDFAHPTACLLSGGLDSSIIAVLASWALREKAGPGARLPTFAVGLDQSRDLASARLVAEQIGAEHHELRVDLDDILEVLPEVIYHLESFDPSLVRSAAANFLISGQARRQGFQVLLSGEGGDELFCGYLYLQEHPAGELFARQVECLGFLHNNASLRLDRMNLCHGLKVVAPFVSGELLDYALSLPAELKLRPEGGRMMEKWILRKAFEDLLPQSVAWRPKQEFSQGSGSAGVLPGHFEAEISDRELREAQAEHPFIRSKEELHYFRLFTGYFGDASAVKTVGQWLSL